MRRREFITVFGAAATASMVRSRPLGAQQPSKLPVVGIFASRDVSQETDAFLEAMRDLGYVEGQNISYAWRSSSGSPQSFPRLALELVGLKPDVIVTAGGVPVVRAVKEATSSIPIVFAILGDAVENGVVPSLAHPGGNVTGLSIQGADLISHMRDNAAAMQGMQGGMMTMSQVPGFIPRFGVKRSVA